MIRVIPKETSVELGKGKLLWLPDTKDRNKPVAEGQVLRVYDPWVEYAKYSCPDCLLGRGKQEIFHTCNFKAGDHVVFPHYEGVPVPALCYDWRKGDYRLIKEEVIHGVIEYKSQSLIKRLNDFADKYYGMSEKTFAEQLLARADVIFHEKARTTSGV